jgi:hypothetical protein
MQVLDFKFLASISGYASGVEDDPRLTSQLRGTFNILLGNTVTAGTGAFGDQMYQLVNYSLEPNSYVELDLVNGTLTNPLREAIESGDAFSTVRFAAFRHEPTSTASKVRVGGSVAGGGTTGGETPGGSWGGLLTNPDWSKDYAPGEFDIQGSPTVAGMAITGEHTPNPTTPTRTTIQIVNLDAHNSAIVSIYIVGEKYER